LFTFTNNSFNRSGDFQVIRAAGYFDEPGTLAFYLIFALVLNHLTLKSSFHERTLIFSGIFTFSLAFFFTLIIYITFYPKWPKHFLKLGIMIICFFSLVSALKEKNSIIYAINSMTLQRFQTSDDGSISGDNRTIYFEQGIVFFKEKPFLGHGLQNVLTNYKYSNYDPSSFIGYLVFHGIIGTTIIFLIFLYQFAFILNFNINLTLDKYVIKLIMLEILLFIQRPLINVPLAFILLILIIEVLKSKQQKLREIN
jgi:hypothetical protein